MAQRMSVRAFYVTGAAALALTALAAVSSLGIVRTEAGPPTIDISGDWNLHLTGQLSASCTLEITQDGTAISGPWSCPEFGTGTFSGALAAGPDGTPFTLDAQVGSVELQAEGSIAPDGNSAAGTWSATYQALGLQGEFTAAKAV